MLHRKLLALLPHAVRASSQQTRLLPPQPSAPSRVAARRMNEIELEENIDLEVIATSGVEAIFPHPMQTEQQGD